MGSRIDHLWSMYYFHPNQAHNGYIETYINLGWTGVALLLVLIVAGYRNILRMERGYAGSLCFAYFMVALVYNITEAAFKVMHPLWIAFLLAVAAGAAQSNPSEEPESSAQLIGLAPRSAFFV
jgi:O-antigen ligase